MAPDLEFIGSISQLHLLLWFSSLGIVHPVAASLTQGYRLLRGQSKGTSTPMTEAASFSEDLVHAVLPPLYFDNYSKDSS